MGLGKEGPKNYWVKWSNICKSKEEGVLGIKDVKSLNMVLLGEWK